MHGLYTSTDNNKNLLLTGLGFDPEVALLVGACPFVRMSPDRQTAAAATASTVAKAQSLQIWMCLPQLYRKSSEILLVPKIAIMAP